MTQEGLDLHRLSHTGQTPLKCPVRPCRRRFISNSALEEHVLAHFQGTLSKSKNRPRFRCQICHKEFAYNSTFSVHMRTHTDERPFEVRSTVACTCVKVVSFSLKNPISLSLYTRSWNLLNTCISKWNWELPHPHPRSHPLIAAAISLVPDHGHLCSVCPAGVFSLSVYLWLMAGLS